MDGDPPPSEGAEQSTMREDETQEVSETPEVSEAQEVSDTQEESGEVMEVCYAEAAAAAAAYRDPTLPLLSSREETDGGDSWPGGSQCLPRLHNSSRASERDRVCHQ